jgi:acyl-CoA synthetase (AMP-forming)/AMP-acid ligase II
VGGPEKAGKSAEKPILARLYGDYGIAGDLVSEPEFIEVTEIEELEIIEDGPQAPKTGKDAASAKDFKDAKSAKDAKAFKVTEISGAKKSLKDSSKREVESAGSRKRGAGDPGGTIDNLGPEYAGDDLLDPEVVPLLEATDLEEARHEETGKKPSSLPVMKAEVFEKKEETKKEEPKKEDAKKEEPGLDEVELEEVEIEDGKVEEAKAETLKSKESKVKKEKKEEIKPLAIKQKEAVPEEAKIEEVKAEEIKALEIKALEIKVEEIKVEEIKVEEIKVEEIKVEEITVEEIKVEEIKALEIKAIDAKILETKTSTVEKAAPTPTKESPVPREVAPDETPSASEGESRALAAYLEVLGDAKVTGIFRASPREEEILFGGRNIVTHAANTGVLEIVARGEFSEGMVRDAWDKVFKGDPRLRTVAAPVPEPYFLEIEGMEPVFIFKDFEKLSGNALSEAFSGEILPLRARFSGRDDPVSFLKGPLCSLLLARLSGGAYSFNLIHSLSILDPYEAGELLRSFVTGLSSGGEASLPGKLSGRRGFSGSSETIKKASAYYAGKLKAWKPRPFMSFMSGGKGAEAREIETDFDFEEGIKALLFKTSKRLKVHPRALISSVWGLYLSLYFDSDQGGFALHAPRGASFLEREDPASGPGTGPEAGMEKGQGPGSSLSGLIGMPILLEFKRDREMGEIIKEAAGTLEAGRERGEGIGYSGVFRAMAKTGKGMNYLNNGLFFDVAGESLKGLGETLLENYRIYPSYPLSLSFSTEGKVLSGRIRVLEGLFEEEFSWNLKKDFLRLFTSVLENPGKTVGSLLSLGAEEEAKVLRLSNSKALPKSPKERSLGFILEKKIRERKDDAAIICEGKEISYGKLGERAEEIAGFSGEMGPGLLGAVLLPWGPDYVAALVSLFKAGAAVMPLDGDYGRLRLRTILSDSFPDLLISSESLNHLTHDFTGARLIIRKDGSLLASPGARPGRLPIDREVSLVLYTGTPSDAALGSMIKGGSLISLSRFYRHFFKLSPGERSSVLQGPGSPEAILGVLSVLSSGAAMAIAPEESRYSAKSFMGFAGENGVSLALTPSALSRSLMSLPSPESLRAIVAFGERMGFFRPQPHSFYFSHGPKESMRAGLMRIVRERRTVFPLGKPFLGSSALIIGSDGNLRPLGFKGEICFSGPLIAKGYLGKDAETRERFGPNPYGSDMGADYGTLLHTGEKGRLLPSGEIEEVLDQDGLNFLGLSPNIPLLEEIIKNYPGVFDARVLIFSGGLGTYQSEAFVIRRGADPRPIPFKREEPFSLISGDGFMLDHEPLPITDEEESEVPEILSGAELLDMPELDPLIGEEIEIIGPEGEKEEGRVGKESGKAGPPGGTRPKHNLEVMARAAGETGSEDDELFIRELKAYLKGVLPGGFAPAHISVVSSWPLGPWGNLDRGALPRPRTGGLLSIRSKKPRSFGELILSLHLFGLISGEPSFSEDFASQGGDSLAAQTLSYGLRRSLGVTGVSAASLPSALEVLTAQSLKELASDLEDSLKNSGKSLFCIRRGKGPALIFVPFISGSLLSYRNFMTEASRETPLYVLNPFTSPFGSGAKGPLGPGAPGVFSEALIKELIQSFPKGDFYLISAAHKGILAFMLAREFMENHGLSPLGVVTLDAVVPEGDLTPRVSPPEEKDLAIILDSLFHYEGVAPKRAELTEARVAEELLSFATLKALKAKVKLISVVSESGLSKERFPYEVRKAPFEEIVEGELSEKVLSVDHHDLFGKDNAGKILKIIF